MKSSNSNIKIPVATIFFLRHPLYDITASVHYFSQPLGTSIESAHIFMIFVKPFFKRIYDVEHFSN